MARTHLDGPICPGCELKLLTACQYMRDWFHEIKKIHPDTHVSWAARGQLEQEEAFTKGLSKDHYPDSPHNRLNPVTKKAESFALDLFQLVSVDSSEGVNSDVARWNPAFFFGINAYNEQEKLPIKWGGKFKTLGDFDHFQYVP